MGMKLQFHLDELSLVGRGWDREDAIREAILEQLTAHFEHLIETGALDARGHVHLPEIRLVSDPAAGPGQLASDVGQAVTHAMQEER